MQSIWVKQAKSTAILGVLHIRKYVLRKNFIAVTLENGNVGSVAYQALQLLNPFRSDLNEIVMPKGWVDA
jgi:hypothetical protein